jgi:hypothetical protein
LSSQSPDTKILVTPELWLSGQHGGQTADLDDKPGSNKSRRPATNRLSPLGGTTLQPKYRPARPPLDDPPCSSTRDARPPSSGSPTWSHAEIKRRRRTNLGQHRLHPRPVDRHHVITIHQCQRDIMPGNSSRGSSESTFVLKKPLPTPQSDTAPSLDRRSCSVTPPRSDLDRACQQPWPMLPSWLLGGMLSPNRPPPPVDPSFMLSELGAPLLGHHSIPTESLLPPGMVTMSARFPPLNFLPPTTVSLPVGASPFSALLPPSTLMVPYPFVLPLPVPVPIPVPVDEKLLQSAIAAKNSTKYRSASVESNRRASTFNVQPEVDKMAHDDRGIDRLPVISLASPTVSAIDFSSTTRTQTRLGDVPRSDVCSPVSSVSGGVKTELLESPGDPTVSLPRSAPRLPYSARRSLILDAAPTSHQRAVQHDSNKRHCIEADKQLLGGYTRRGNATGVHIKTH